jgi:hypothetical protein
VAATITSSARSAVGLWARSELRRRWRALIALGLISGLAAGLALAAVAGARRTSTAYARFREATAAPDALVFGTQLGIFDQDYSAVTELPEVVDAGTFNLAPVAIKEHEIGSLPPGDGQLYRTLSRPRLVSGRLPHPERVDEIVVNRVAAARYHLRVGQALTLVSSDDIAQFFGGGAPSGGPTVRARVVGVGESMMDLIFTPDEPSFVPSAAFLARFPQVPRAPNLVVRLRPGTDVKAFHRRAAAALGLADIPVRDLGEDHKRITHSTDLERTGLLLFAGTVVLAGVVLVGQAITRVVYAMAESVPGLRALGLTNAGLCGGLVVPLGLTSLTAAGVAIGSAVLASGRFPVGQARRLDPDLGIHADWVVLATGAVLVVLLVLAAATFAALRVARAFGAAPRGTRGSAVVRWLRGSAPLPVGIGAGLALEAGRGDRALPVRPAIAGAVAGVLGVVGALGLVRGIDDAVSNPRRSGQVWNAEVFETEEFNGERLRAELLNHPGVADVAGMRRVPLDVEGAGLPVYALEPVRGDISFVVLDGRAPRSPDEAAIGPATAKALNKKIGDRLHIGSRGQLALRIVGTTLLAQTPHTSFDQGVWATPAAFDRVGEEPPEGGPDKTFVVTAAAGVKPATLVSQLTSRFHDVDEASVPQDVLALRNVRTLPRGLAVFLVLLGLAALGHALVTAVRRRRHDLAVLKALGFRPLQNAACILWLAMTVAVVGLAFGLPLGAVAGRVGWRWVTETTSLLYVAPLAAAAVALAVPVAVVSANVLAALPAQRAARVRPAEVLRSE